MDCEVWIRDDFLVNCCHAMSPPRQFTVTLLKRLIAYVRQKYATFPCISYEAWKHVACSKMELRDSLCWMYYSSFYLYENMLAKDETSGHLLKSNVQLSKKTIGEVSCAGFAVMASLQNACRPQVLTPSGNESFPTASSALSPRTMDFVERFTEYFASHLSDIFELLWICDINLSALDYHKASSKKLDLKSHFSLQTIETLDYFLEGCRDGAMDGKVVVPFSELVQHCGLISAGSGSMTQPVHEFMQWLRRVLVANPLDGTRQGGVSRRAVSPSNSNILNCTDLASVAVKRSASGADGFLNTADCSTVGQPYSAEPRSPKPFQLSHGNISKNRNYDDSKVRRPITFVLNGLVDRTVIVQNPELVGNSIKIVGLVDSNIYLPINLTNCLLVGCRNSKVITGPIVGVMKLENCSDCIVGGLATRLVIYRTRSTRIFIRTPMAPLLIDSSTKFLSSRLSAINLLANCRNLACNISSQSTGSISASELPINQSAITDSQSTTDLILAPLNYNYPGLSDQLKSCGFVTKIDLWNKPMVLSDSLSNRGPSFELMDPVRFYQSTIPFYCPNSPQTETGPALDNQRKPMDLLFPLPNEYANKLAMMGDVTDDVNHYATSLLMNDAERKESMAAIADLFYDWLDKQKACEKNELRHLSAMLGD